MFPNWVELDFGPRVIIHQRSYAVLEKEIICAVEESPEGGYEARALGYSIFTQAETLEDLRKMVRDRRKLPLRSRRKTFGHPFTLGQRKGHLRLKLPRDTSGEEPAKWLRKVGYEFVRPTGSHMRPALSCIRHRAPRHNSGPPAA